MNGQFIKIPGGYARQIDAQTQIFVPEAFAESFVPETGEVTLCAPDYAALEAEKAPAVHAAAPGAYAYTEEMQQAPTGWHEVSKAGFERYIEFIRKNANPPKLTMDELIVRLTKIIETEGEEE